MSALISCYSYFFQIGILFYHSFLTLLRVCLSLSFYNTKFSIHLDARDNLLRGWGPVANTASTVSAYPSEGTFDTLATSCEVFTCEIFNDFGYNNLLGFRDSKVFLKLLVP